MIRDVLALSLALAICSNLPLAAQTASTGAVLGKVTDPQGAVVPRAEVNLTDTATNLVRTQRTNDDGHFTFNGVLPGTYTLKVTAQGFRLAELKSVIVEVNRSFTADFALEVGNISDVVELTAAAGSELQKIDAQLGNVMDVKMIRSLPNVSLSTLDFLSLQPATTPGTFGSGGTVSGARSDQNTLLLDGIDVSDNLTGGQGVVFTQAPVGVNAISEFRVVVANPNASFGRSAGGQISLSSQRGSNSLRGSGYWSHQNDDLNANTWTNNRTGVAKSDVKDNRSGFSLGGPIWRDKTFFFGNYEARRFPRTLPFTRTVPTESMRNGILRFRDASGQIVAYPLATSTLCGPAGTTTCDPRSLGLSPTVRQMYAVLPQGNDPALGDGLNTIGYRGEVAAPITADAVTVRFDHNLTSKLQLMGRYSYSRNLAPLGGNSQLDIRDPSNVVPLRNQDQFGASVIAGQRRQASPLPSSQTARFVGPPVADTKVTRVES